MTDPMDRPDASLAAALRSVAPAAPVEEVDWGRLHAALHDRAALPLARRRRAARLKRAVRWAALAVPAAAAAGVALVVLPEPRSSASVEEVVHASLPAGELDHLISGRAEREALLLAAVGDESVSDL